MEVQVYRTNSSSYQGSGFAQMEKEALESLPGVKYIQSLTEFRRGAQLVLISNTHTVPSDLPPELLAATVLWIHPNSGYDNFTKDFVLQANFPIVLGNTVRAAAVTEYILGCVFKRFTPVPNHAYWSEDRDWDRSLLRDQKTLIIGMGEIGKTLYQALRPLCPNLLVIDPYINVEEYKSFNLKNKASKSDVKNTSVVLIASSLTPTSRDMINKSFLSQLDPQCLLVNSARGEIIKEEDLEDWLRKNPKAMAYLDVFRKEPFLPGLMADAKNLNKTSHIAGVHRELNYGIIGFEKSVLSDFLDSSKANDFHGFIERNKDIILGPNSPSFIKEN